MDNIRADFEYLETNQSTSIGWKSSIGHLFYNVKIEFTLKARWVKYYYKTLDPDQYTHACVVPRDSVSIALTYAEFNGLTSCQPTSRMNSCKILHMISTTLFFEIHLV